ncbi:ABC transporter ATP-binding protein [Streptomyces sp. URMC 123]|uniref:ABC transporter ATP-binding protein n=1 Tax=Streptomyces sp. URMC 123 TaxID=3423403 RepID=UPI003F1C1D55
MNHLTTQPADGRTALEVTALAKAYRRRSRRRPVQALRNCTFRLPGGRICALVGPNGAGKSTLLTLLAGLDTPTEGTVRVFGAAPRTAAARTRTAYLGQDKPLYPGFTIAETLRFGRSLNPATWDQALAERIVDEGDAPRDARVDTLSRGQRARVAFALALAKRPELLLLDEPMADLDPLARHRMTALLMAEAAEHGTTIVLSSHVLAELENVCDYLLLVDGGRVRLAGEAEDVLGAHRLLTGVATGPGDPPELAPHTVVETRTTGRQITALIRPEGPVAGRWESAEPSLEEVVLAYLRTPEAPALLAPSAEPLAPAAGSRFGGGAEAAV